MSVESMDPAALAAQLRRPSGADGTEVARRMNESNAGINDRAIALLGLCAGDRVLEIGPGNAAFAGAIVALAEGVTYTGLDWSPDMVADAERLNRDLVAARRARFVSGSSESLPFPDAAFDKILAVNTLYFWDKPATHLAEIARVLTPDGRFCLAFGDRDFMRDLPFAAHGFTLYDNAEAQALVNACGFRVLDVQRHHEAGRSNTGATIEKTMLLLSCARKPA